MELKLGIFVHSKVIEIDYDFGNDIKMDMFSKEGTLVGMWFDLVS